MIRRRPLSATCNVVGSLSVDGERRAVRSFGDLRRPSMCAPLAAGTGALAHNRKTISSTARSGVNVTIMDPVTVDDGGSTLTDAS